MPYINQSRKFAILPSYLIKAINIDNSIWLQFIKIMDNYSKFLNYCRKKEITNDLIAWGIDKNELDSGKSEMLELHWNWKKESLNID